ncbi:MAG: hypothetical protein R2710_13460 [Acidimicrobiales bacterium]
MLQAMLDLDMITVDQYERQARRTLWSATDPTPPSGPVTVVAAPPAKGEQLPLLRRLGRGRTPRSARSGRPLPGRAQHLHHDRPDAAGGGRGSRRRPAGQHRVPDRHVDGLA